MRRIFFRFFIAVFSIAVLMIAIQAVMLVYRYMAGEDRWMSQIFNSFVDMTVKSVNGFDSADELKRGFHLMASNPFDDRVSGLVVRDSSGDVLFTAGKTPKGKPLNSTFEDMNPGHSPEEIHKKSRKPRYSGVIDISITEDGSPYAVYSPADLSLFGELNIPKDIAATDIIGSIMIKVNENTYCIIDILAFSPMTYEYTKDVAQACANSLVLSVFVCLIIALIGAGAISSSNAKFIDTVRSALGRLAKGEENIKLIQPKSHYLNDIFVSIHDLDKSLQANARNRSMWLNSISHDLNTPAMSMKVIIDGISDGIFQPDEETLIQLKEENSVLNERIARVTELSELQSDTVPVPDTVDTRIFSNNVLSSLDCGLDIKTEIDCSSIVCDCTLMSRACTEVLKNAISYTTDPDSIKWRIWDDDSCYFIEFSDTGSIGLSDNELSLFEPWTRGDYSRNGRGNGLGLPIVGAIAALHRGNSTIKQEGNRTVVTISWPK